jgi:chemotaxis protein MotB
MCPDKGQYRICPQGKTLADLRKEEEERERQRLMDQLATAQKQLADRDREIASVRSSANDSLRSAQADLDQSKTRIGELERQLADRDQEVAALRTRAGDASQLASQLSAANSDKDQLSASLATATNEKDQLSASLATATSEKDRLAAALAAAQSQVAALQAGAGDKDKLAADLSAVNQRVTDLESQLASAQSQVSSLQAGVSEKDKLAAELGASKQRLADLEKQLADRNKELAGLRGELSAEMAKLNEAQRGLVRALRPEIEQGNITVDLNNERLLINLASSMLFGSGEDQLKPAGVDALKRVGAILKDYPEYVVEVDGHTDNRPIRSSLKKRFPTNKELSEARAVNGITALAEGGVSAGTITSAGYADTRPVAPNTTDEGRQKNRRVEVRVTPKS